MKVQVLYTLPAVFAHVGYDPIAAVTAQLFAQTGSYREHMPQQSAVALLQTGRRVNMLFGNYQKMRGANKAQKIIGAIGLVIFFIALVYIAKFYSLLW